MQALVIDDSRAMRRILSGMLRDLGFEVTEAVNGRLGFEELTAGARPDIVLVDWNMPEMNGLEFVHAVRAEHRFDALPLMMVTTETEMDKVTSALGGGVNEYVMKPFDQETISQKLQLLGVTPQVAT